MASIYAENEKKKYLDKLELLLQELPQFVSDYHLAKQLAQTPKTQLLYARHMKTFLEFLITNAKSFENKNLKELTLQDLANVSVDNARDFSAFISRSQLDDSKQVNSRNTTKNYIESISSYYNYFISLHIKLPDGSYFSFNPLIGVDKGQKKKRNLVYLTPSEQEQLLSTIESGNGLSDRQKKFQDNTALRDLCICQILLDTGIRVSELVGLDIDAIDLDKCCMYIIRKGDKEDIVYFSDETRFIIEEYLEVRPLYHPVDNERALFLSSRSKNLGERLTVRSVQRLVKKYAIASNIPKSRQITPHKLRSSFAMDALAASGNIALVQKMLGHENITTTTIYAQAQDSDKEKNRNIRYKH